jgi:glycosyltransferase involved in cell wall biosynthesis
MRDVGPGNGCALVRRCVIDDDDRPLLIRAISGDGVQTSRQQRGGAVRDNHVGQLGFHARMLHDGCWSAGIMAAVEPPTPPRYGIDARWLTSGPPSGQNYVRHLIGEVARGECARQHAIFVRPAGVAEVKRLNGPRAVSVPASPSLLFNIVGIPARTPRSILSVLHQNFTPPFGHAAAATVLHDLIFLTSPEQFTAAERAYLGLIPRLLPRAAVVVAVSEHVADLVRQRWPRRDPATVIVAPNGIDERLFAGAEPAHDTSPRERLFDHPYVLYLGRLNTRKNLPRLIEAFARAGLDDHHLVLAGAPDGRVDDLEGAAAAAGISRRVHRLGRVPGRTVIRLMRDADAFAYVSLDEGFGVPPVEAMVFGLPVIASDIAAMRETAAGGGAQLVDPHDVEAIAEAIRRAVLDDELRRHARSDGPRWASRFRWSTTAQRVSIALKLAAGEQ